MMEFAQLQNKDFLTLSSSLGATREDPMFAHS
jgi:hypothetical protein